MPAGGSRGPRTGRAPQNFKLVLLGDASVGKSCLVVRFSKGEFHEAQEPTIGAAFMTQTIELENGQVTKFEIWDTAGQERYRSLAPMYYRGAAAAVIVYDVTSKDSFDGARSWVSELQSITENDNLVICLCGNKVDIVEENSSGGIAREVETSVAQQYARDNGILFFETSAKTGFNVQKLFIEIAKKLPTQQAQKDSGLNLDNGAKPTGGANCCGGGGN